VDVLDDIRVGERLLRAVAMATDSEAAAHPRRISLAPMPLMVPALADASRTTIPRVPPLGAARLEGARLSAALQDPLPGFRERIAFAIRSLAPSSDRGPPATDPIATEAPMPSELQERWRAWELLPAVQALLAAPRPLLYSFAGAFVRAALHHEQHADDDLHSPHWWFGTEAGRPL